MHSALRVLVFTLKIKAVDTFLFLIFIVTTLGEPHIVRKQQCSRLLPKRRPRVCKQNLSGRFSATWFAPVRSRVCAGCNVLLLLSWRFSSSPRADFGEPVLEYEGLEIVRSAQKAAQHSSSK